MLSGMKTFAFWKESGTSSDDLGLRQSDKDIMEVVMAKHEMSGLN